MTVYIILGLLAAFFLFGTIFLNLSPVFGGKPSQAQIQKYLQSNQYNDGQFANQIPTAMNLGFGDYIRLLVEYMRGVPDSEPEVPLPIEPIKPHDIEPPSSSIDRIYWLGHSAIMLETDGKTILVDPMMGPSPAPHPWLGSSRYGSLPIEAEALPPVDIILISHDHYDHLDYGSIQKLKKKTRGFYVPLGVGAHLAAWGVDPATIHELDWGNSAQFGEIQLICAPARHFSGRALLDRDRTLWCSWILETPNNKLYFSGDSGYGPHFKDIGKQYGPFDLAMLECGQYDLRWEAIHMIPEQTVQAALDLNTKRMMPIHWGAFTLSLHSWTDPVERVTKEAQRLGVDLVTPKIGEAVNLSSDHFPHSRWWERLMSVNLQIHQ